MRNTIFRNKHFYFFIFLTFLFFSCSQTVSEEDINQISIEDIKYNFTFIIISDLHARVPGFPDDTCYDNEGNLNNIRKTIKLINESETESSFLVATGDLVGCLFSENPDDYGIGLLNPAEKMLSFMDELNMLWYPVLGNHDYQKGFDTVSGEGITTDNQEAIESVWLRLLDFPPYYSFIFEGVNFVVLNSCRGESKTINCIGKESEKICTGSFDDQQLDWLTDELEKEEPAILFCHHPPSTDNPFTIWSFSSFFTIDKDDLFYDITYEYRDKIMGIFSGHGHLFQKDILHGVIPVCETAALGDLLSKKEIYTKVFVDIESESLQFVWNQ